MPNSHQRLLEGNQKFIKEMTANNPDYFKEMAKGQTPSFLWIGCSDSRVPADRITSTQPGEIFVHRNIANLVVNTDLNLLSVIQYSVEYLKVKHIIVCGHYGCGGVLAAMSNKHYGLLDNWLSNIKNVYRMHRDELDAIEDEKLRAERMVELSVMEQVYNLAKVPVIQESWHKNHLPELHGWVYDIDDGLLRNLDVQIKNTMDDIYKFEVKETHLQNKG